MGRLYDRSFNKGHQSELLYNEELHKIYEALRHIVDRPDEGLVPKAKLDGSLWYDKAHNELDTYDKPSRTWNPIFGDKFQIITQILQPQRPENPVPGQLWICDGVLYFFNDQWTPIKAMTNTDSQFNIAAFSNFVLASPLWNIGNIVVSSPDNENNEQINTVISRFQDYCDKVNRYREGKINIKDDSFVVTHPEEWTLGHICDDDSMVPTELPNTVLEANAQFLAPNLNVDRFFVDDHLVTDYNHDGNSTVSFEYPLKKLFDTEALRVKVPSLVHINPGVINNIKKRLFKVDHVSGKISVPLTDTEYYGFDKFENKGYFLRPRDANGDGDYDVVKDGIVLSQSARHYSYVVTITYEFNWVHNTGAMASFNYENGSPSYYVANPDGAASVFLNGFNLEDNMVSDSDFGHTITVSDANSAKDEMTGILYTSKRETGYIREVTVDGHGVIHLSTDFISPLVFVNGELMSEVSGDFYYDKVDGYIYVSNAKEGMVWSVLEGNLKDTTNLLNSEGYVTTDGSVTCKISSYKNTKRPNLLLFIDGLLINPAVIEWDEKDTDDGDKEVTLSNKAIRNGSYYMILIDDDMRFTPSSELYPAIPGLGYSSQAIMYRNGYYVGDIEQVYANGAVADTSKDNINGRILYAVTDQEEIKRGNQFFAARPEEGSNKNLQTYINKLEEYVKAYKASATKTDVMNPFTDEDIAGKFYVYNSRTKEWEELPLDEALGIIYISNGFKMTPAGNVALNFTPESNDKLQVYAFRYAHDKGQSLFIRKLPSGDGHDTQGGVTYDKFKTDENGKWIIDNLGNPVPADGAKKIFGIPDIKTQTINPANIERFDIESPHTFEPGSGALSVWVNGVRLEPDMVNEDPYGKFFVLNEPVKGCISYCIESRKAGTSGPICKRTVLDENNTVPGTINVYRMPDGDEHNLFPGNVTVYIDGLRQPKEAVTVIDDKTLCINDTATMLLGNRHNFPDEKIVSADGKKEIHHNLADHILVEVRPEYDRQEKMILFNPIDTYAPDNDEYMKKAGITASYENILLHEYDIPENILETSDEMLIFVNGLFFGMRSSDGYRLDKFREQIVFTNPDDINKMIYNPLYEAIKNTPDVRERYLASHNGKMYEPPKSEIILNWL